MGPAFRELLQHLYRGEVPKWGHQPSTSSRCAPKDAWRRASGPRPLEDPLTFSVKTFQAAVGRKLNSVERHDLVQAGGDCSGGRRSSLGPHQPVEPFSDERIRGAKSGQWGDNSKRAFNNSAAYTEKPDPLIFMKEWRSPY